MSHPTAMLTMIRESWGWSGLQPTEVVAANDFGNVVVRAQNGMYWRICPEELACETIAHDDTGFEALWADDRFQLDWRMQRLVQTARELLGPVPDDWCYCLKLPAVLGGKYDATNLATISRQELLAFAGFVAEQIKDVPDGGYVKFKLKE